jgi:predicted transcriptional regulator
MIMTKMTKMEKFAMVKAMLESSNAEQKDMLIEFVEHEMDLLSRKSSKGTQTKTQKENEILLDRLEEALEEMTDWVTISEFQEFSCADVARLSNQKLSALLRKLIDRGSVVKTTEKKKSYFALTSKGFEGKEC